MGTIIALSGRGNCGKTLTIRILRLLMMDSGYDSTHYEQPISRVMPVERRDFSDILVRDDKRVGITSAGDTEEHLTRLVNYFIGQNCNIIVCACHTSRSATYDSLNNHQGYQPPQFREKSIGDNVGQYELLNREDAQAMLQMVNNFRV